ncbi:tetratricopeptide repeat protein [candidate division KSB1 bacterium]|nr:tetratricopeptide repeat protein [candidate division KSB1 bacterium]
MLKPYWYAALVLLICSCSSQPIEEPAEAVAQSEFLLLQANEALRQNEFDIALAITDSAQKLAPNSANVHFMRARVNSEIGQWEKAENSYHKVLELDPNYRGVWNNLGNNTFRQQKFEKAIAYYQKEIARNVKLPPDRRSEAAIPYYQLGRAYVELGKVDSARSSFERALAYDSLYALCHFNFALLLEDEGELAPALAHAQRAWQIEPPNLEYRYLLGELLVKLQRYEEALSLLQEVAQQWPWHHGAHYNLGQALVRLGRQEEAQKFLAEAERVRAQDAKIEHLENTVRSLPNAPMAHAALASAFRRVGRYNDAMHAYKVAAHLAPTNMEIQNNIAILHLIKGDTVKAIQQYQRIMQYDPTLVEVWLNLGVVYALARQPQAARAAWENALKYQPNHPLARKYLAKLAGTPQRAASVPEAIANKRE